MPHYRNTPETFWQRVEKTDGCWLWTGGTHRRYGVYSLFGKRTRTHRIAWTLAYGPIPEGMVVCHHCDNPVCVRPDHLFLGTQQDNLADMYAKGRNRQPAGPMGEKSVRARLTTAQVKEICERYAAGAITHSELAAEYGVHCSTIGYIIRGATWKYVGGVPNLPSREERRSLHARRRRATSWAKSYRCCIDCGTCDRPHAARGLCVNCYAKEWRESRR